MWKRIKQIARQVLIIVILITIMNNSGRPSQQFVEKVRVYTRQIEFDYVNWTLNALFRKLSQSALGQARYLSESQQQLMVDRYLALVKESEQLNSKVTQIYSDPQQTNPQISAKRIIERQRAVKIEMDHVGLFAEGVLQTQVTRALSENSLTSLGQPLPPVQYHTTALPYALIISPRNVIRQDADISLLPNLTLDQIVELEKTVEQALNVSALVVPVGGIGVYPTMVMETDNLPWLAEVVSHEWTHNFLTFRPLGLLYDKTPALRTINETTASIAGKEIGEVVIRENYPWLLPNPEIKSQPEGKTTPPPVIEPAEFNYQAEMHTTRVTVDTLLSEGKITEAESYMETRRLFFLENGYRIRRLNQAYFAFYGAYADTPGGAAGEDPVGAAVRSLRSQSPNLANFVRRISWVTSFEGLENLLTP
ncbi:MAG: hypothetical protein BGO78_08820 [Chloroflexi bacterium 44-23]|nr:MAG: hypothetical protein BGO78_08820 [Chloroflexi bacterium 44-23]